MPDVDESATPFRASSLVLDCYDPVLLEPAISGRRAGSQIGADLLSGDGSSSRISFLKFWATGAWTLKPIQDDIFNIHETTAFDSLILDITKWAVITDSSVPLLKEILTWTKADDLTGMSYSGTVATSADKFIQKQIAAGTTWDQKIATGHGFPSEVALNTPQDVIAISNATYLPNQGFFIRWQDSGTGRHHPEYVWGFAFGQYYLAIKGNGQAELWEYCHASDNSLVWRKRKTIRYARPSQIGDAAHTLMIYPQKGANGELFLHFAGGEPDAAGFVAGVQNFDPFAVAPTHDIFRPDRVSRGGDRDESPGDVTKQNICVLTMRRDKRIPIQISKIGWQTSGFMLDLPFHIPANSSSSGIDVFIEAEIPSGCSITPSLVDADTGGAFSPTTTRNCSVRLDWTGTGTATPVLHSYTWRRPEVIGISPATPFTLKGVEFSCSGFGGRNTEKTGRVLVEDAEGAASLLDTRAFFPALMQTSYVVNQVEYNVKLQRGYVLEPIGEKWGRKTIGMRGREHPVIADYPDPDAASRNIAITSMKWRLRQNVHKGLQDVIAVDPTADPNSLYKYQKATDVIRAMIGRAGFPSSMINIRDIDRRIWAGTAQFSQDAVIHQGGNYGMIGERFARDYIGAEVFFEENFGEHGQWILVEGTRIGDYSPILHLVSAPGSDAPTVAVHAPEAYPAHTTFVTTIQTRPLRPEFNSCTVICPIDYSEKKGTGVKVEETLYNYHSYKVPGSAIDPDPQSPHFIGFNIPLVIVDLGCYGADIGGTILENTRSNVLFKCGRFFELLCQGYERYVCEGILMPVIDPVENVYRLPRYQDLITINGVDAILRSCSPHYNTDKAQMAIYEILVPPDGC